MLLRGALLWRKDNVYIHCSYTPLASVKPAKAKDQGEAGIGVKIVRHGDTK